MVCHVCYVSGLDRFPGSLPEWVELQRRYSMMMPPGGQPPGSMPMHGAPHIPGVYPPASLANDLLQRERERLERLGTAKTEELIFLPWACRVRICFENMENTGI